MKKPKNFINKPFDYHQKLELQIEKLTNLGLGIGRIDNWVVMVPFVIPGEIVVVKIFRNHSNYSEADLVKVITPSKYRVSPRCSLFGICGGCQYQHIDYAKQLEIKEGQISNMFNMGIGINYDINRVKYSNQTYNYRSKITPHYNKPDKNGDQPFGFLANGRRNKIIDVEECSIATEKINKNIKKNKKKVLKEGSKKRRLRGGTLLLRDTIEGVVTDPKKIVSHNVGSLSFQFKAGDFFQNNLYVLPNMIDFIKDSFSDCDLDYLIDAYCGVGLFSLSCSSLFSSITGIEISESSVFLARANAKIHGIDNVSFKQGRSESIFEGLDYISDKTAMIIDPPRKGCDELFLNQLIDFLPKRLVYISCDPATQVRDLKLLLNEKYSVKEIQPFDFFPHTRHTENVVILDKF